MQRRNSGLHQRFSSGILLLDSGMHPLCGSSEAIRILAYPDEPENIPSLPRYLTGRIRTVYGGRNGTETAAAKEFVSGRRHYLCQVLPLDEYGRKNSSAPTMAVLLERTPEPALQVSKIAQHFRLTLREQEAVKFLIDGLSSEEIAKRMGIRPNTVKAFLRLVMIKMGVSSRVGIIGKILKS
jgi:DNA-binding CsgD family transcriptional regulator